MSNLFIAPNGKLYKETKVFRKACVEVTGVSVAELWCDSYELNMEKYDHEVDVLIPGDVWPYEKEDHWKHLPPQKFGGVRLDIDYDF